MSTTEGSVQTLDLRTYLVVPRRRWLTVLAGLLVGAALSALYLQVVERSVSATTLVGVNVISTDPFNAPRSASGLIDAQTEVQSASSSAVLRGVAETLNDGETLSELRRHMTAAFVPDATVMRISFTSDTARRAERGADAIAAEYLAFRADQAQVRLSSIVDRLTQRRDLLRQDLAKVNARLAKAQPGSNAATQAESDRQLINIELDSVVNQINTFLAVDVTGGSILTSAAENPTRITPSQTSVVATGLALGLVLGLLGAFVRDSFDARLKDERGVRQAGGGQVLGEFSVVESRIPPVEPDAESVRRVRELLLATMPAERPVLVIADLTTGRQMSDVGINLAWAFAETGRKVELVMPDPDPDFLDLTLGSLRLDVGKEDFSARRFVPARGARPVTVVVPSVGALRVDASEGFVADVVGDDARQADLTVIAVPHHAAQSLILAAGRLGHSVILVVSKNSTSASAVSGLAEQLAAVGASVQGTVMVPRGREPKTPQA